MAAKLNAEDKKKVMKALRDISDSWTRQASERDLVNNTKKDICEEVGIDRKMFNRVSKVFHASTIEDADAEHTEFMELYQSLVGK